MKACRQASKIISCSDEKIGLMFLPSADYSNAIPLAILSFVFLACSTVYADLLIQRKRFHAFLRCSMIGP